MSPLGIGALIVFAIGIAIATALVPKFWRGQITAATVRQYWWPGGDGSWIRFVRSWPVLFAAGWLLTLGAAVMTVKPETPFAKTTAIEDVILVLLAATFTIAMTIFVFAWPRQLIPPWLRPSGRKR